MNTKRAVLAAAAAALFTAGVTAAPGIGNAEHHEKEVHCEGVNACKGKAECKTAHNECGGLNSCKGQGWVSMTAEECEAAKKAAAN